MVITLREASKRARALKAEVDNRLPESTLKKIRKGKWHRYVSPTGVVCAVGRWPDGTRSYLHRLILGAKEGKWVRFRSGNGLDCRKRNMMVLGASAFVASARRPVKTESGYRGVNNIGGKLPWQMRLTARGRRYRSVHRTAREAALAYDQACVAHFGELAVTNRSLGKIR